MDCSREGGCRYALILNGPPGGGLLRGCAKSSWETARGFRVVNYSTLGVGHETAQRLPILGPGPQRHSREDIGGTRTGTLPPSGIGQPMTLGAPLSREWREK